MKNRKNTNSGLENSFSYFWRMMWPKKLPAILWTIILTVLLLEQSFGPYAFEVPDHRMTDSSQESICLLKEIIPGHFLLPAENRPIPLVQVIREPLIKWRFVSIEKSLTPFIAGPSYPEIVQDIERCPTVSRVLFPYHEFL